MRIVCASKNLLMKDLEKQAREKFADEITSGDIPFDDTLAVSQVISEVYDPPPGAAGTKLTLTMQVEYSLLYASASDLTELASLALNASLPTGFRAASEALTVKPVTQPSSSNNGATHWTVRAEREIFQQIDPAQVIQAMQGVQADAASAELKKNFPLASAPQIQLSPVWWPWMPMVPFRIAVVTQ